MTEYEQNKDNSTINVVKKESGRPGRKKQIKKPLEEEENIETNENMEEEVIIKNSNGVTNGVDQNNQLTVPNYDIIEQLISPIR